MEGGERVPGEEVEARDWVRQRVAATVLLRPSDCLADSGQ